RFVRMNSEHREFVPITYGACVRRTEREAARRSARDLLRLHAFARLFSAIDRFGHRGRLPFPLLGRLGTRLRIGRFGLRLEWCGRGRGGFGGRLAATRFTERQQ